MRWLRARAEVALLGGDDVDHALKALAERGEIEGHLAVLREEHPAELSDVRGELASARIMCQEFGEPGGVLVGQSSDAGDGGYARLLQARCEEAGGDVHVSGRSGRRTRVVGAFPDGHSALMLTAARLRHVASTKWGKRRYLSMDALLNQGSHFILPVLGSIDCHPIVQTNYGTAAAGRG